MNIVNCNGAGYTLIYNYPQIHPQLHAGYLILYKKAGRKPAGFFSLTSDFPLTFYRAIRSLLVIFYQAVCAPFPDGRANAGYRLKIFKR